MNSGPVGHQGVDRSVVADAGLLADDGVDALQVGGVRAHQAADERIADAPVTP